MSYQQKQSIILLLQAAWAQIAQLNWSDAKADNLQDKFDDLLAIVQDKMKDVTAPAETTSVDPERKQRRKEKKDKKTDEPAVEPVKATRKSKKETSTD